ncbi:MAG: glycine cleavage system aminomethyltransferase GcvT [Candidatus Lokiarchaeota archaeon]|nr:glycine cleavage system aminomethyltransferase GcvT [Candidatus Lokiarchaeota archaeon]MBD3199480.1 glycine cleavage system aminomethyltransferase GcvT [Candidatus Lokiarchaeota archaeon]
MNTSDLRKTPLNSRHKEIGAKMTEFGGWEMPVSYEGIISEHKYVRDVAGVFDISHMGEFLLEGEDVKTLLQTLMVNDLRLLEPSKGQYSCICYENGTVVDDCIYYEENPTTYRMIVNASNREKDFKWINSHIDNLEVTIKDLTSERSRLAFQGPKTDELLNPLTDIDVSDINRFYFRKCKLDGISIFIARTGYTGEKGFELSASKDNIEDIFNKLLDTEAKPIGLGARDSLRLEACYSLYGHEISDKITPIEANIGWVVKQKDDIDYIGKNILLKQKNEGTSRIIVGLTLKDPGIMRQNYKVFVDGKEIGYLTSGGYSPTLEKSIGLALIQSEYNELEKEVDIQIRKKMKKAEVVSTPFYQNV